MKTFTCIKLHGLEVKYFRLLHFFKKLVPIQSKWSQMLFFCKKAKHVKIKFSLSDPSQFFELSIISFYNFDYMVWDYDLRPSVLQPFGLLWWLLVLLYIDDSIPVCFQSSKITYPSSNVTPVTHKPLLPLIFCWINLIVKSSLTTFC